MVRREAEIQIVCYNHSELQLLMGSLMRELTVVLILVGFVLAGFWAGTDQGIAVLDVEVQEVEQEEEPVPVRSPRFEALYRPNEI
jgi:hypothetical protein